jgi:methylmalonyl-CoA/ethylmalonyl-CoA epimerase
MPEFWNHSDLDFHHIGVATRNIASDIDFFRLLGYEVEGSMFIDYLQGIEGCFMTGGGPRIELISDLNDSATVAGLLRKNVRLYHFAYHVSHLSIAYKFTEKMRGQVVRQPLNSTAFTGMSVMFVAFRNQSLLEFIGVDDVTQIHQDGS